mgnify:FL=1|tara:strand:+ start:52 stop:732 length:681 start_codon:yes stop_codon:yes gene_type:complete
MGGRKVVKDPVGYHCINLLVQRAIAGATRKANSRARGARWNDANRERISKTSKDLYTEKKDQRIAETTAYRQQNKQHLMKKQVAREKQRRQTDEVYHISGLLRQRLRGALNRGHVVKEGTTEKLVGASATEVLQEMTLQWADQQGKYDIDHIFPFRLYNLNEKTEQLKVMNICNLQALSPEANGSKLDKLPTKDMAAKVDPTCWPPGITMDMLPDIYPGWSSSLRM